MVQQYGNDRLGSDVLNCCTEFEQERDFRTVGVNSVTHDAHDTLLLVGYMKDSPAEHA